MPKSTAQLRAELAEAVRQHRLLPGEKAGCELATAAEALLAALDAQPSRAAKDFRVVFQHNGDHVRRRSVANIYAAVELAGAIGRVGGRVQIFTREPGGQWSPITERELRTQDFGYILDHFTYGAELRCGR